VEVKARLASAINRFLDPIRERRAHYAAQPGLITDILVSGNARMREESTKTMALVRQAMRLPSFDSQGGTISEGDRPGYAVR
jgi:tryptophanyl-tRNA synthetase